MACEAIAAHSNTRVDPERFGPVAWAMNVGVVGSPGPISERPSAG